MLLPSDKSTALQTDGAVSASPSPILSLKGEHLRSYQNTAVGEHKNKHPGCLQNPSVTHRSGERQSLGCCQCKEQQRAAEFSLGREAPMGGLSPGVLPQALPCLRMGCCAPPVLLEQGDEGCALPPELTADGALTLPPSCPLHCPCHSRACQTPTGLQLRAQLGPRGSDDSGNLN